MRASLVRQESLNTSKGLATFRSNTATICAPLWLHHRPLPSSASLHIRRGRGHTGQSLWYGASKFFYFLFFQQSWRGESCTFLAWCCITWSDATLPSSWTYGIVPFINIKSRQGRIYWSQGLDYGTFYNAPASQEPLWSHGIPRSRSVIWASSNMRSELHDENPKQITHSSKAPV